MRIGLAMFGSVLVGTAVAEEPTFRPIAGTAAGYYQTRWQIPGAPSTSLTSARASSFAPEKQSGVIQVTFEEPPLVKRPKLESEPTKLAPLPSLMAADFKMSTGPKAWFNTPVVKSSVKAPMVGGAVRVISQDGQ